MKHLISITAAVVALLLLLLVSFAARSANRTWAGTGSVGNWSTVANWVGAAPVSTASPSCSRA